MKHIEFLIKAQRSLIKECKKLRKENEEMRAIQEDSQLDEKYYSKYQSAQDTILELNEKNSKMEIELLNVKSELESRNNLIIELRAKIEELTNGK